MTAEERAKRMNEIPLEKKWLQDERRRALKKNWHGAAAMLKKRIEELDKEFGELYNSFRKGRKNEKAEN